MRRKWEVNGTWQPPEVRIAAHLEKTGDLSESYVVDGLYKMLSGRNGGGDPWFTDGRLLAAVITLKNP
jgi:hypothetical protein